MPDFPIALVYQAGLLAAAAVCFAYVLVGEGMLLAPVQRWLREKWRYAQGYDEDGILVELDNQWWWPPLWGCFKCVAGQWGFWVYLIGHLHGWPRVDASAYHFAHHLYFTSLTILFAALWRGLYSWSQSQP